MGQGFNIGIGVGIIQCIAEDWAGGQARGNGDLDQGSDSRDGKRGPTEIYFEGIMERLNDGLSVGDAENG